MKSGDSLGGVPNCLTEKGLCVKLTDEFYS
jgi:hypothetical protein